MVSKNEFEEILKNDVAQSEEEIKQQQQELEELDPLEQAVIEEAISDEVQ